MEWKKGKPKRKGWYIVTTLSGDKSLTTCAYWLKEKKWTQFEESESGDYMYLDDWVVAYAELPEPYEE